MNHQTNRYPSSLRSWWSLVFICAFLLAGCSQSPAEPVSTPGISSIRLEECQLSAPGAVTRLPAKCGTLAVPEDRQANGGREINLSIAVIPAISRDPAPDPLFLFAGGPGQAASETYVQLSFAFERINQKRDIILIDQRGTGKSNPLDCSRGIVAEEGISGDEQILEQVRSCLASLDADPRMYTTPIAMQDIDQARAALGYEKINLYGVSYGTRAALTYLQLFPEQVRSVILDGVVPQDEPLGLDVARDAQQALDLIFSRCEQDSACSQAFPNVRQEFVTLLDTLRAKPVEVTLPHPTSGRETTVTFTADEMAAAIRLLTYAPETAALLPLLIHQTASQEDFKLMTAQYLIVSESLVESISEGMNYSVICSEDYPFILPEAAAKANQGTYLGESQIEGLKQICDIWPAGNLPDGFHQPVRSDVPVLLLSGEADPVTPPENAASVAETLPHSLSLIAAGQGHNIVYRGCIPNVITDFIEAGTIDGLDTTCVQKITAPPFFIDFTGPKP